MQDHNGDYFLAGGSDLQAATLLLSVFSQFKHVRYEVLIR